VQQQHFATHIYDHTAGVSFRGEQNFPASALTRGGPVIHGTGAAEFAGPALLQSVPTRKSSCTVLLTGLDVY
jgi:hypothetical protein